MKHAYVAGSANGSEWVLLRRHVNDKCLSFCNRDLCIPPKSPGYPAKMPYNPQKSHVIWNIYMWQDLRMEVSGCCCGGTWMTRVSALLLWVIRGRWICVCCTGPSGSWDLFVGYPIYSAVYIYTYLYVYIHTHTYIQVHTASGWGRRQ